MKRLMPIAAFAFALLLCAGRAKADGCNPMSNTCDGVTFTLVQADLTGNPGDTLTWEYDVKNESGGTITANSINSSAFSSGGADSGPFDYFNFFSGIPDGTSLTGPLYEFMADQTVMSSFNSGVFDLNVSLQDSSTIDLFADYSATITPGASAVPEPASGALVGLALTSLLLLRRLLA
jgi:hypothetical protein